MITSPYTTNLFTWEEALDTPLGYSMEEEIGGKPDDIDPDELRFFRLYGVWVDRNSLELVGYGHEMNDNERNRWTHCVELPSGHIRQGLCVLRESKWGKMAMEVGIYTDGDTP